MEQESYFDRKERDQEARKLRAEGHRVICSSLRNQQTWDTGIASFGLAREQRPSYRVGTVYMLTVIAWLYREETRPMEVQETGRIPGTKRCGKCDEILPETLLCLKCGIQNENLDSSEVLFAAWLGHVDHTPDHATPKMEGGTATFTTNLDATYIRCGCGWEYELDKETRR